MIIEFIGATGAGKTTLARGLVRRGIPARRVRMATDLVTDRLGRRSIGDPHAINLLADVSALPWFLRAFDRDRDFVRFAVRPAVAPRSVDLRESELPAQHRAQARDARDDEEGRPANDVPR